MAGAGAAPSNRGRRSSGRSPRTAARVWHQTGVCLRQWTVSGGRCACRVRRGPITRGGAEAEAPWKTPGQSGGRWAGVPVTGAPGVAGSGWPGGRSRVRPKGKSSSTRRAGRRDRASRCARGPSTRRPASGGSLFVVETKSTGGPSPKTVSCRATHWHGTRAKTWAVFRVRVTRTGTPSRVVSGAKARRSSASCSNSVRNSTNDVRASTAWRVRTSRVSRIPERRSMGIRGCVSSMRSLLRHRGRGRRWSRGGRAGGPAAGRPAAA